MTAKRSAVIHLHRLDPDEALERLNRITGLRFAQWPESLVRSAAEGAVGEGGGWRCLGQGLAALAVCRLHCLNEQLFDYQGLRRYRSTQADLHVLNLLLDR